MIAPVASRTKHAWFAGLMAFAGHAYAAESPEEIGAAAEQEGRAVLETAAALADEGVETSAFSVGTTPTIHHLEREGAVTEIRPGNYVFYDATQVTLGVVPSERCALSVLATVVARPSPTPAHPRCRLKGSRGGDADPAQPGLRIRRGSPRALRRPAVRGTRDRDMRGAEPIPVGERLAIVPNHACTCVNLHERMLVVENGEVADVWAIDARGWAAR